MDSPLNPILNNLVTVSMRTGLSRSSLYREIRNQKKISGEIKINPAGRLRVVHIGRSVRVRECDLMAFIDDLAGEM